MNISRIKFSSSIRIGNSEYSFLDIERVHQTFEIKFENNFVRIIDSRFSDDVIYTSMANVIYYAVKNDKTSELLTADSSGIDQTESAKNIITYSRSELPKASRSNKRSR